MPGFEGSDRRRTLPADWPTIVKRILIRDHHRCQHIREDTQRKCGRRASDVDHIISYKQGGTDDDSNLQALCAYHHGKKTGREGGTASGRARAARRTAEQPVHPGLLTERPPLEPPAPF
jgi:5-methylcytosine-specific restriction endonuclease McrA